MSARKTIAMAKANAVPTTEGLYWVRSREGALLIAAVHGESPFLRVELVDPFDEGPRLRPTAKEIGFLTWEGKIEVPKS